MNDQDWFEIQELQQWLMPAAISFAIVAIGIFVYHKFKGASRSKKESDAEISKIKSENQALTTEIRHRLIENIRALSRVIQLNPVIPGNTPDDSTLESRARSKCLDLIIAALPNTKGQGIRMAEFIHQLSDQLFNMYGKDNNATLITIDAQALILDAECAAHIGLMLNELISNALQYAPVPGEKSKVTINFKEREDRLFISVGDNGIGMKSPYQPKFSFGLQLVNTLVQHYKGEMIISSRPGTRVEIMLKEYKKSEREVFITPTTKVY